MKTRLALERASIAPQDAHILVVEDDISRYVQVRRALDEIGIGKCEWKTQGWDVVEFAQTMSRVDLILMDWQDICPNGQTLTRIRSDNHLQNTVVVAMGLDAAPPAQIRKLPQDFDAVVEYPWDDTQFCKHVTQILRGK